ncbi:MAG: HD domain-containing protein [Prevotella sp.]|nr:HD domain-containing protein [Prevotella sp.]
MSEYVLSKIVRYNNRTRLQDESVAEHTCFVSLFCLKIMAQLNLDHETERQILILAALHDMAESKTSDIPHNVKANYPAMQSVLDKIEHDYYEENWERYLDEVLNPSDLVYNILKLADAYSVYQYCLNERNLGNYSDDNTEILIDVQERVATRINAINSILERK